MKKVKRELSCSLCPLLCSRPLVKFEQLLNQRKPDNVTVNNVCLTVAITNSCNRYEQGAAPPSITVKK